jgi:hypothetical protein
MINVIERFNFKWESGESIKYKIPYVNYDGHNRNYFPDFVLNEKYVVEIKPKKLWTSDSVKRKQNFAQKWCVTNGFIYKLTDSIKLIKVKDIKILIDKGYVKLTDRYQQKYINHKNYKS